MLSGDVLTLPPACVVTWLPVSGTDMEWPYLGISIGYMLHIHGTDMSMNTDVQLVTHVHTNTSYLLSV